MLKTNYSKDFFDQINDNFRLTTVEVTYRMPDYLSILQEFIWQTMDKPPEYPRVHVFLTYWEAHIEGPIYSVKIANVPIITPSDYKIVDKYFKI